MRVFPLAPLTPALCSLIVTASACGDLFAFPVQAEVEEFTVPGDPYRHHENAQLGVGAVPPIELELPAEIQPGSVSLSRLELRITATALDSEGDDEDDLTFLSAVNVFMQSKDPLSKLATIKIATWEGPAPRGDTILELQPENNYDLSPYLAEGFRLELRPVGVVPYDDVSIEGTVHFVINPI